MIRGPHGGPVEVSILRDTGTSLSLLLREKLPKGVIEATHETVMIEGIGGKRVKIPLCKIILKSQWKNGPIQVGVVDKLPMKGISLILGNEAKTKKCQPCKMAKMSVKNEATEMARRNAKNGSKMAKVNAENGESKMAKMNTKNEERKMARMNNKHEDNMAAEPRGWHKLHSHSQSEKVERKEVRMTSRTRSARRILGILKKVSGVENWTPNEKG